MKITLKSFYEKGKLYNKMDNKLNLMNYTAKMMIV